MDKKLWSIDIISFGSRFWPPKNGLNAFQWVLGYCLVKKKCFFVCFNEKWVPIHPQCSWQKVVCLVIITSSRLCSERFFPVMWSSITVIMLNFVGKSDKSDRGFEERHQNCRNWGDEGRKMADEPWHSRLLQLSFWGLPDLDRCLLSFSQTPFSYFLWEHQTIVHYITIYH